MPIIQAITDLVTGKAPPGTLRSSKWRSVRKAYLKAFPFCAVCGGKRGLEVHHVVPFFVRPDLELDMDNLITLCERKNYGINCHLLIGHLGNYRRHNPNVHGDAKTWHQKLKP